MTKNAFTVAALLGLALAAQRQMNGQQQAPTETRIPVGAASLYGRVVGEGKPVIVLHGGPDFDHRYLLPDLDRLKEVVRLVYYDQRGRGKSSELVKAEDVSLASDLDDLDKVREHFRLESTVLLGHSWGTVLALEYALRHPTRVSGLILMNPAPASGADLATFRKAYVTQLGADMDRQREIATSPPYLTGDPAAVVARYRIHFKHALGRPGDYERLMSSMKSAFEAQEAAGIVKARAVEDRLMLDTWQSPGYDLLPKLRSLRIPTVIIAGELDFIPVEISEHIATAIPGATLVTLRGCGHFTFMECPDMVRIAVERFIRSTK